MKSIFNFQFSKFFALVFLLTVFIFVGVVNAQSLMPTPQTGNSAGNIDPTEVNITKPTFKLIICDGPPLPSNVPEPKEGYVPCDFKGLMMQARHLINIAMVLGVLIAIISFTWAGALYISGIPSRITQAHAIFPKVFWGFIIMLSAWFIVYQILTWLTGANTFGVLLGNP